MGLLARRLHGQLGDAGSLWPLVSSIADGQGVDPVLVMAMIDVESSFNSSATRRDADGGVSCGLMQLRTETASMLAGRPVSCGELFDPALNISLGVQYLAQQLARYYGNAADAVAAYNGGAARKNAAGEYVNTKGIPNVQRHVDKVFAAYPRYQGLGLAGDAWAPVDVNLDPVDVTVSPLPSPLDFFGASNDQALAWLPYVAVGLLGLIILRKAVAG